MPERADTPSAIDGNTARQLAQETEKPAPTDQPGAAEDDKRHKNGGDDQCYRAEAPGRLTAVLGEGWQRCQQDECGNEHRRPAPHESRITTHGPESRQGCPL